MTLAGQDSEYPQPLLPGVRFTAVYVGGGGAGYTWTQAEAHALLVPFWPVVVPPQVWPWPDWIAGTCQGLVQTAVSWGLNPGSPLFLDVEEFQYEAMDAEGMWPSVAAAWQTACAAAHLVPGIYSSAAALTPPVLPAFTGYRWLAEYPGAPPSAPVPPPGFHGWQYAGNVTVDGRNVDLDVALEGSVFCDPRTFGPITIPPPPIPEEDDLYILTPNPLAGRPGQAENVCIGGGRCFEVPDPDSQAWLVHVLNAKVMPGVTYPTPATAPATIPASLAVAMGLQVP